MDLPEFVSEIREFRGEMSEFKRTTVSDLREIKADVKLLNAFKWRVASGAAILSIVLTAVTDLVLTKFIR